MGQIKGDKARYNRERRKKIARRVETRALRVTMGSEGAATAPVQARRKSQVKKAASSSPSALEAGSAPTGS